ncbi:hypothetical protein DPMN_187535 [Dreissena polymorpha]|uniref:Uncharacterized protein n=1 Tax=Dreissena polymorpha TaxID=45954 RepID=A0A9D4DP85_DREPO|nr:hypothetical protein DPMN_187535 [Dreissena polymorpha]
MCKRRDMYGCWNFVQLPMWFWFYGKYVFYDRSKYHLGHYNAWRKSGSSNGLIAMCVYAPCTICFLNGVCFVYVLER